MVVPRWNAYLYENGRLITFNILDSCSFLSEIKKILKDDYGTEKFRESIRKALMYSFWSKSEYEFLIEPLTSKSNEYIKISVYDQVMINFDNFLKFLIINREEILRIKIY